MTSKRDATSGARSHDRVPYPNRSQRAAHPRHLETVATLFGMTPAPAPRCKVLELGCATGSNLIAQAYDLAEGRFLGIDLSGLQIAEARKRVQSLGLKNIELRHADITDVGPTWGQFDYIICDAVYSWTSAEVQDTIMRICRTNLAPNGVAFVSYNVQPGWHFRVTIRDMLLYHVSHLEEPQDRIDQARAIVQFLAESCQDAACKDELRSVSQLSDALLFHQQFPARCF